MNGQARAYAVEPAPAAPDAAPRVPSRAPVAQAPPQIASPTFAGNAAAAARVAPATPAPAPATPGPAAKGGPPGGLPALAAGAVGNAAIGAAESEGTEAPAGEVIRLQRPKRPNVALASAPIATLTNAAPSAAAQALATSEGQTQYLFAVEQQRLASNPPSMTAPTGLPAAPPEALEEEGEPAEPVPADGAAGEVPGAQPLPPEAPEPEPLGIFSAIDFDQFSARAIASASASAESEVAAVITQPIDVYKLLERAGSLDGIETSAGARLSLPITPDIDPKLAESAAAPRDAETAATEAQAASERTEDPGIDSSGPRSNRKSSPAWLAPSVNRRCPKRSRAKR